MTNIFYYYKIFIFAAVLGPALLLASPAEAEGPCFCFSALDNLAGCQNVAQDQCTKDSDGLREFLYDDCQWKETAAQCDAALDKWNADEIKLEAERTPAPPAPTAAPASKSKFIPDCALEDKLDLQGECGDVSIFVRLLLNGANYLFTIIGALALGAFVFGGFRIILSSGNPEKLKAGADAIFAALIGLVVAFLGYLLIQFMGEAIGLKETFLLR